MGTNVTRIGSSPFCKLERMDKCVATSLGALMLYDTLVFIAISCRLMKLNWTKSDEKESLWKKAFGQYLPQFSRALLRDGQNYYGCAHLVILLKLLLS
jgi:hypothetical protein